MMVDLLAFDSDSNLISFEDSLTSDSWCDRLLGDDEIVIIGGNSTYGSAGLLVR